MPPKCHASFVQFCKSFISSLRAVSKPIEANYKDVVVHLPTRPSHQTGGTSWFRDGHRQLDRSHGQAGYQSNTVQTSTIRCAVDNATAFRTPFIGVAHCRGCVYVNLLERGDCSFDFTHRPMHCSRATNTLLVDITGQNRDEFCEGGSRMATRADSKVACTCSCVRPGTLESPNQALSRSVRSVCRSMMC